MAYWDVLKDVTKDYTSDETEETATSYTGIKVYQSNDPVNDELDFPHIGDPHPYDSRLNVVRIRKKGHGQHGLGSTQYPYSHMILTVNYADTVLQLNGESLMQIQVGSKMFEIREPMFYASDNSPVPEGQSMTVTVSYDEITLYSLWFTDPLPTVESCQNKVNSTSWRGFAAGYVLYLGADITTRRDVRSSLGYSWSLTHRFAKLGMPWNYAPRGSSGVWELVQSESGAVRYPSANFSALGV